VPEPSKKTFGSGSSKKLLLHQLRLRNTVKTSVCDIFEKLSKPELSEPESHHFMASAPAPPKLCGFDSGSAMLLRIILESYPIVAVIFFKC
jgi:hypothetical protein